MCVSVWVHVCECVSVWVHVCECVSVWVHVHVYMRKQFEKYVTACLKHPVISSAPQPLSSLYNTYHVHVHVHV